jgi:tetratricopeptide (TPR) repeat protein
VEGAIELQRLCEAAEKAIAGSNPEQARSILGQIKAKGSGNEYLKARMAGIDSLLDAEAKKNTLTTWYDQAQKYAAEGKLEMAIAAYEKLLHQAGDYKDAKINLEKARQALTQNQFNEKLQAEYAAGETAMRSRNWPRAIFAFENVLKMAPNSHDARQRLEEAQSELERESTDAIVARYYAEGVSALNRNDLGGALAALEKVHRLNPDYRDVAGLLAELENALQKNAKQLSVSPAAAVASSADLETLYQDALLSMEKQDWVQAEAALEKLQLLQPSYRDVTDQLATVRAHLVLAESSVTAAQSGAQDNISLYVGGALVALILLPLLGFVVFSPATRANIHLLRSNYKAAAQIYEKILTRHPDRLKLYPILANIYLMLGRHDQQAMKVYKTILQLKLATHKYEEINSIVAQNYLTEGRTDTDAIEVLENALKAERHKQEQG